jgi:hypothetical protein
MVSGMMNGIETDAKMRMVPMSYSSLNKEKGQKSRDAMERRIDAVVASRTDQIYKFFMDEKAKEVANALKHFTCCDPCQSPRSKRSKRG